MGGLFGQIDRYTTTFNLGQSFLIGESGFSDDQVFPDGFVAGNWAWYSTREEVVKLTSFIIDAPPDDKELLNPSDVPEEVERMNMFTWADDK